MMIIDAKQDDDRRPRWEPEPEDLLEAMLSSGAREKAIMEHGKIINFIFENILGSATGAPGERKEAVT